MKGSNPCPSVDPKNPSKIAAMTLKARNIGVGGATQPENARTLGLLSGQGFATWFNSQPPHFTGLTHGASAVRKSCQEKAYFLGFLYADGSSSGRNIRLEIVQEDAHILERLAEALDSNIAPKLQKVRDGERPRLCLSICNKQIVSDLSTHGVVKNKTFKIRLPILADIALYRHFLRGYMDGDGTIYVNNERRVCRVSLVSNSEFCLDVKGLLATHINVNAYIGSKHGTSVKALEVSGTQAKGASLTGYTRGRRSTLSVNTRSIWKYWLLVTGYWLLVTGY